MGIQNASIVSDAHWKRIECSFNVQCGQAFIAYIWVKFAMQMLWKTKIFTVCFILTNTITFKHITQAQMCASCQKTCNLDKMGNFYQTRKALSWDIWRWAAQMHKYSLFAYIWVKFTMQMLRKMKIFTVCCILTNTITFKLIIEAHVCPAKR